MGLFFKEEDRESLLEEVTPLMAAEALGMDIRRMGSNFSILCPDKNHNDQHYGSCMIQNGGRVCHCYACGRNFSALSLIMMYNDCSYYEAMCTLAEIAGREEEFQASKQKTKKEEMAKYKTVPNDVKEVLNLAKFSAIRNFFQLSDKEPEDNKIRFQKNEEGLYLLFDNGDWRPWQELCKEEPETMEWLVQNKCKERMSEILYLKKQLKDPYSSDACNLAYEIMKQWNIRLSEFLRTLDTLYQNIEEIYVDYGGRIREPEKIIENMVCNYIAWA